MNHLIFQQINPVKNFFLYIDLLDRTIFNGVNNLALKNLYLDEVAIFCASFLGYVLIGILFVLLIRNFKKYYKIVTQAFISGIFARFIIVEIIRFIWDRPRPFISNSVNLLINHSSSASFPSGHAAFFFALSTLIYLYNKKIGILFLICLLYTS
ncbi:phosphatase PAP2 family protein, partial [Candidatus Atribacteria bacterium MT.SAG.1]